MEYVLYHTELKKWFTGNEWTSNEYDAAELPLLDAYSLCAKLEDSHLILVQESDSELVEV